MSQLNSSLSILTALALLGCGANSNTVTLTVVPGSNAQAHIHQLSREFFSQTHGPGTSASTCLQKNLMVGFKVGPDSDDNTNLSTFPIQMRMSVCTSNCASLDIFSWLNNNTSLDQPIQVTVPKAERVEVGVLGVIVNPEDSNTLAAGNVSGGADQNCDELNAAGQATTNYSVIGHKVVPTDASRTLDLNTWVVLANPASATPTPYPGNSGGFYCPDPNVKEQCAYRDLLLLSVNDQSTVKLMTAEYFFGKNRSNGVLQQISTSSTANQTFIPSIFPVKITYNYSGTVGTVVATKADTYTINSSPLKTITVSELGSN